MSKEIQEGTHKDYSKALQIDNLLKNNEQYDYKINQLQCCQPFLPSSGAAEKDHVKVNCTPNSLESKKEGLQKTLDLLKPFFSSIESELSSLKIPLDQIQSKKNSVRSNMTCYIPPLPENNISKPRNVVIVKASGRLKEFIAQTVKDPQNAIASSISKASFNLNINTTTAPLRLSRTISPENKQKNIYDIESEVLLSQIPQKNLKEKEELIKSLSSIDFSMHCKSQVSLNYKYDFPVNNPFLLVSGRLSFRAKQEQVFQFVRRKRQLLKRESKARFNSYKIDYFNWTKKAQEELASSEIGAQKLVNKVDIYGKQSPRTMAMIYPEEFLDGSEHRKESLELDSDLCK